MVPTVIFPPCCSRSRRALSSSIKADIDTIFELQAPGSTDEAPAFEYKQVNVYGISCQYVRLGLSDEVTEDQARTLYSNYAKLRADKRGEESGDVEMYIYTPDTVFFINEEGLTKVSCEEMGDLVCKAL